MTLKLNEVFGSRILIMKTWQYTQYFEQFKVKKPYTKFEILINVTPIYMSKNFLSKQQKKVI